MAAKRTPLEAFKFAVYLLLPVGTIAFFNQPQMIKRLIETREYIVYPPEGERPPRGSKEDIQLALKKMKGIETPAAAESASSVEGVISGSGQEQPARKKWFGIW